ncbi:hypothetical protein ASPFODRAFT_178095 [Aspergillus luchuensis CBS 106.47]|uniref:Uncharacterized protein n=1 Tax=Aspergillus luchuensis (strain CBS 106.47) TaxID=1137211 RepID=A0A1M3U1A7_ASPLC|nr:hypothetical protein ASPFODRAFT_178095 [Aspergillus luchuensis CBS 106.47]
MTNKHPRKPCISASSLGQVRKIYMSKMTEQGCSRTLKDKCRDIWDKVIDDAVEADAECSGPMWSYGYGKELEPLYIPDKPNGVQKKENGKQAHTEGSTESETESEEESNSETEVEIDPSLDGSDGLCWVWRLVGSSGSNLTTMSSPPRSVCPEDLDCLDRDLKRILKGLSQDVDDFLSSQTSPLLGHMDDISDNLDLQVTKLEKLRDQLVQRMEQLKATLKASGFEVEDKEASQGEKKESEQNQHQHHAAKSPKHRLSPPAKVKVQESDGDADSEREVEAEKEDFNTLFG